MCFIAFIHAFTNILKGNLKMPKKATKTQQDAPSSALALVQGCTAKVQYQEATLAKAIEGFKKVGAKQQEQVHLLALQAAWFANNPDKANPAYVTSLLAAMPAHSRKKTLKTWFAANCKVSFAADSDTARYCKRKDITNENWLSKWEALKEAYFWIAPEKEVSVKEYDAAVEVVKLLNMLHRKAGDAMKNEIVWKAVYNALPAEVKNKVTCS